MSPDEAIAIAERRIADEAERRTGSLDLSNLGLETLPEALFGLRDLRLLDLGTERPWDNSAPRNRIAYRCTSLAALTQLEVLSLSGTDLTDLDWLGSLAALQQLNISGTQVVDLLPLSGLSSLQRLEFSGTQVVDLSPLSGLSFLQRLEFCSTQVADLSPLTGLSSLQQLDCHVTQVVDLSPLSVLSSLQQLGFAGTLVMDLSPLSGLSALQWLDCNGAQVADLSSLSGLSALQGLACNGTQVSDLSPLSGLSALQQLDCSDTKVADLSPLSGLSALEGLFCSGTQVSDLSPLSGLSALEGLFCSGTQVSDLSPLSGLFVLQQLDCSVTKVVDLSPLSVLSALRVLNCGSCQVADLLPLSGLSALQSLDCKSTQVLDLSPLSGLSALQRFNCSSTQVVDLSPLSGMSDLQQLDCSGTRVADLSPLSGLSALQQLNCGRTQVLDLSPLSVLSSLQELNCGSTQVVDLSPLSGLSALQRLDCGFTQVANLSPLFGLSALRQIHCSYTYVVDLSPLSGLFVLQQLDCSHTRVVDLSPLSGLSALQQLYCSYTQLVDLSPLSGLSAMKQLGCSGTQLVDLSPLSGLSALQEFDCGRTRVLDLSPLSALSGLRQLGFSGTQVVDLSPLSALSGLRLLDCSHTQIVDLLPLSGLSALQQLDCGYTRVVDLSPLSGLSALQQLDCSNCRLISLPPGIINHASLKQLILDKAQVPGVPPTGVLPQGEYADCLAAVRAYFRDLEKGTAKVDDVKLLLLGNGGVGKTQIARWLAGQPFDPTWNSTHGVQVVTSVLLGEPPARLHVWDFGGQDIYHGTHALFLHSPAVLMPVWDAETERQARHEDSGLTFRNYPLSFWIDLAHHQGHPDSPVLVVQSKCDQPEQVEPPFQIPALRYYRQLHVSAKQRRGGGALHEELLDAIAWLRDPAGLGVSQIGSSWLRVQRRLEAMRDLDQARHPGQRQHRLLERGEFDRICEEEGGVSSPIYLLAYLDANGIIFHRPGLFRDRIVLDQAWALEAIYTVFDRSGPLREIRRSDGRFRRWHLAKSVWGSHSRAEQELFISMMRSCGICFLHRTFKDGDEEDGEYIAPDLLPERHAVAAKLPWDTDAAGESAILRYALLHGGLIRAIMSEIGEIAGQDALYWQGGVWAFEANTGSRLLIEQHMTGPWQGEIHISTQRGQATTLLDNLMARVERTQASLGMQPTAVERSSIFTALPEPPAMQMRQEKPKEPECYVSYAWGDDKSPEGHDREKMINQLCETAEAKGIRILRDKQQLRVGDSISDFMRRIGAGDHVFVLLSDKYLHSPFCMYELLELWRTSKQDPTTLRDRIRVFTLDDADIWKPLSRTRYAAFWKKEYDELEVYVRDNGGTSILGERDFEAYKRMGDFYRDVGNILSTLADIVQPHSFEELEEYGLR